MTDRRNAPRATRLLDPVWHQLRSAVDRLYAEIEPDAQLGGVNITVLDADGTMICYFAPAEHPGRVQRYILTDQQAVADAVFGATIDATVEEP